MAGGSGVCRCGRCKKADLGSGFGVVVLGDTVVWCWGWDGAGDLDGPDGESLAARRLSSQSDN